MNTIAKVFNRKTRIYLYSICVAVAAYLVFKGIVKSEELLYLNAIFMAVFGLAIVNVPQSDAGDPPPTSVVDKATD